MNELTPLQTQNATLKTDDQRKLFEETVWREDKMMQDENYLNYQVRHDEIRVGTVTKIRDYLNGVKS